MKKKKEFAARKLIAFSPKNVVDISIAAAISGHTFTSFVRSTSIKKAREVMTNEFRDGGHYRGARIEPALRTGRKSQTEKGVRQHGPGL